MTWFSENEHSHPCVASLDYGDWRINNKCQRLMLKDIEHLLTDDRKKTIKHNEIAWKGYNLRDQDIGYNCNCCGGARYHTCDTAYTPIIVENMPNPANRKYRMIDGRHRMQKLRLSNDTESDFYVLEYTDVVDKLTLHPRYNFIL
jgi:hypothetical protein